MVSFGTKNDAEDIPLRHLKAVMDRCPISVDESQVVSIVLSATGGLQCGGTIALKQVAFASAASIAHPISVATSGAAWNAELCNLLYLGLRNAVAADGGGSGAQTLRFISELP